MPESGPECTGENPTHYIASEKTRRKKADTNVYGSGFASGSSSGSGLLGLGVDSSSITPLRGHAEKQDGNHEEKTSLNPKPETKKHLVAKDGTHVPPEFDTWSNADRLQWLEDHDPDSLDYLPASQQGDAQASPRPKAEKPKTQAPIPSADAMLVCTVADGKTGVPCTRRSVRSHTQLISERNPKLGTHSSHYCQEHWNEYLANGWIKGHGSND